MGSNGNDLCRTAVYVLSGSSGGIALLHLLYCITSICLGSDVMSYIVFPFTLASAVLAVVVVIVFSDNKWWIKLSVIITGVAAIVWIVFIIIVALSDNSYKRLSNTQAVVLIIQLIASAVCQWIVGGQPSLQPSSA